MTGFSNPETTRRRVLLGLGCTALAGPVSGKGAGKGGRRNRIALSRDAVHVIEGGREHVLRDTVFDVTTDYDDSQIGLKIEDRARIDVLRIRLAPGARAIDRFMQIGSGVHIGLLDVKAARQTDHHDDRLDGFVKIQADDIRIDEMKFHQIDRCVTIHQAARVWIGSFEYIAPRMFI